jgi:hypothetical protein
MTQHLLYLGPEFGDPPPFQQECQAKFVAGLTGLMVAKRQQHRPTQVARTQWRPHE